MSVIKFVIRREKITWLVNDNWIMFIYFLLTVDLTETPAFLNSI